MIDAGIDAYWCRMPVYPATGLPQVGLTCQGAIPTADLRRELQAGERWSPLDGHALGHHGSPVKDWHLKECNWWLGQSLLVDGQFLLILQYHKPTKKTHWQVNLLSNLKGGAGQFSFPPCDFEHLPGGQSIHFYGLCHYIRKIWSPCAATQTSSQNHSVVLRIIQIDVTYH